MEKHKKLQYDVSIEFDDPGAFWVNEFDTVDKIYTGRTWMAFTRDQADYLMKILNRK